MLLRQVGFVREGDVPTLLLQRIAPSREVIKFSETYHVGSGSLADIAAEHPNVRFTPKSRPH